MGVSSFRCKPFPWLGDSSWAVFVVLRYLLRHSYVTVTNINATVFMGMNIRARPLRQNKNSNPNF